jgi:hypothetical protein
MKKTILTVMVLCVIGVVSCGVQPEKDDVANAEKIAFPISGRITNIVKGTSIQMHIDAVGKLMQLEVSQQATVSFNSKPTTVKALAKDQTIYAESSDGQIVDTIIIEDWPGFEKKGQDVTYDKKAAFGKVLEHIRQKHPELGLPDKDGWQIGKPEADIGETEKVQIWNWNIYRMRLVWVKGEEVSVYDCMLYKANNPAAIWSGTAKSDGSVREDRYEKP